MMIMKWREAERRDLALHTPSVALGMLERSLHFFPENFREDGAAHGACARLTDVRRPKTAGEDSLKRLFRPIRLQSKTEGFAEHQRSAQNRANRSCMLWSCHGRSRPTYALE